MNAATVVPGQVRARIVRTAFQDQPPAVRRDNNKSIPAAAMLSIAVMAVMSGANSVKAVWRFGERLSAWLQSQEGTLPRRLALDGKFVKEVMGVVSMVDRETGAPAPARRTSRPTPVATEANGRRGTRCRCSPRTPAR